MKPAIEYYKGALSPKQSRIKQRIDTTVNTIRGLPRAAAQVGGLATSGTVLGSFKKGGKVKKTGLYKLHAGERVVKRKSK